MFTRLFMHRPRQRFFQLIWNGRRRFHYLIAGRALRRAIHAVYAPFTTQHKAWVDSLFDEHFLVLHAAPLLLEAWASGHNVTPARLAAKWRAQFPPTNALAEERCTDAIQVAADFLTLLEAELNADLMLAVLHSSA